MKHLILLGLFLLPLLAPLSAQGDDAEVLSLARDVIKKVRYGALISVGEAGQPRSRIVDAFAPDDDFVIYVATKPNTRKVAQVRHNPKVTLFYFDPAERHYLSVMGQASLVEDTATKIAMRREADSDRIYPDFPDDYLLIKIVPDVVEGLLPGYRGRNETWMPARVEL
ncbi:MAG: general stress protein 26 [Candidatus Azotimanducaceae bacterium]|jgi:general stress protein 26